MRSLLSAAVFAVLLSTAACVSEPIIIRPARTEAPAARPADTKLAAEPADTKAATEPAETVDTKVAAGRASDEVVIPEGWSLVTSSVGGFRAAFPSSPEVQEHLRKTDAGAVRMITYGVSPGNDTSYLLVLVGLYPDGMMVGKSADQLMKGASDLTLAQHKFTLVSETPVRVDGARGSGVTFPGRDVEAIDSASGMRISFRMILVHDRMYEIMYLRDGEQAEPFEQLLSTFSLQ